MRVYNLLHYGADEQVAGLCLMIVLVTLTATVTAAGVLLYCGRGLSRSR